MRHSHILRNPTDWARPVRVWAMCRLDPRARMYSPFCLTYGQKREFIIYRFVVYHETLAYLAKPDGLGSPGTWVSQVPSKPAISRARMYSPFCLTYGQKREFIIYRFVVITRHWRALRNLKARPVRVWAMCRLDRRFLERGCIHPSA